ncbi:MAG: hypothetical protein IMY74_11750 [Bacteroidetes bacterium]|nr:hypothetical protein [Bacteroidota bacterium]
MDITVLLRKWTVVLLFFLFIVPFHTFAAEPEEVISINININIDWNHRGSGTTRTIGTYMVKVTGKARLTKKKGEFLKYEPVGLRATGKFKQETIQEAEGSDCFGQVIERIDGFDTVPVTAGKFLIDGYLGHLGKMAAMQYKGNISPEGIISQKKDSRSDNYSSVLVAGFKVTQRGVCGNEGYIKEGILPIGLNIFKELTPMSMHGSYTWKSKDGLPSFKIDIGDFQGDRRFSPIKGQGARYRVSWRFGKITPIVQVWYKGKNITDSNNDVLVGEKVKLEAVVKPHWMSLGEGKWEIEGDIIADYKVSQNHEKAKVINVEKYDEPVIEFVWKDGQFFGIPQKVKYSGTVEKKEVIAETTFNVFEPKAKTTIHPAPSALLASVDYPCELILGGNARGNYGMTIDSYIEMPPLFKGQPFKTQFVQLTKGDAWIQQDYKKSSYLLLNDSTKNFALDTEYPYIDGSSNIVLNDTPGGGLNISYNQMFIKNQFQSYLMFLPSSSRNDPECVWINLSRIDWDWAGAARRISDKPALKCIDTFKITFSKAPDKYLTDISDLPIWSKKKRGSGGFNITAGITNDSNWKPPNW